MKHSVQIHWDDDFKPEEMSPDIQTYRFATKAELSAFMEGVAAARDTGSHTVIFDSREAPIDPKDVQMICRDCGSEHVLRDAWAEWDPVEQEWVLHSTFDDAYCEARCDGPTKIEEANLLDWMKSQEEGAIIDG